MRARLRSLVGETLLGLLDRVRARLRSLVGETRLGLLFDSEVVCTFVQTFLFEAATFVSKIVCFKEL